MTFTRCKVVSAVLLFGALFLLGACRQKPLTLTSDFIDYSYEVPENLRSKISDSATGRPIHFWAVPTPLGTAVLTQMLRRPSGGGLGCCSFVRLVNLSLSGAVVSEKTLFEQDPTSGGFDVFPIFVDDSTVRLAAIERIHKLSRATPDGATSTHRLILAAFTRDSPELERHRAMDLPRHVTVEDVWQRADGLTVLVGTRETAKGKLGWISVIEANSEMLWDKTLPDWVSGRVYAHEFRDDNTLVLRESAARWGDGGVDHVLSLRVIDLVTGAVDEESLLSFPRSDMSDTPLGKISPRTYHVASLAGGDHIITLSGWYKGAFDQSRVARVTQDGKIAWITTVLKGSGGGGSSMVLGQNGEIIMDTDDHENNSVFISRLNLEGEVFAQHRVDGMELRQWTPHPDGGYLVWAIHEPDKKTKKWRLLRIRSFPSE